MLSALFIAFLFSFLCFPFLLYFFIDVCNSCSLCNFNLSYSISPFLSLVFILTVVLQHPLAQSSFLLYFSRFLLLADFAFFQWIIACLFLFFFWHPYISRHIVLLISTSLFFLWCFKRGNPVFCTQFVMQLFLNN